MPKKTKLKIFLAVIILLLFLHYTKITLLLENFIFKKISLPQNILYQSSNQISNFFNYLLDYPHLIKENQELKNEINNFSFDQAKLKSLETENIILQETLKYVKENSFNYLTVKVIGRSTLNPQLLILDQGRLAGLKEGLIGIYNNGIIVGKIYKVEDNISYLLLITDNQSLLAAKILNAKQTIGLTSGELGLNVKLTMIPQNEDIKIGDLVVSSGLEENIPSNLLIGEVIQVKEQPAGLFKDATISPFFDIRQLNYLTIILAKS